MIVLNKDQIETIERAAGLGLTLNDISYLIGISPRTLDRRLIDDDRAKEAYEAGRAKAKLKVTEKLFDLIEKGETAAILFYLKCQCGWREKDRVTETTGNKAEITIYLPQKDADKLE